MKQNITLALDREVLVAARIFAAQQGISVSAMLAEELREFHVNVLIYAHDRDAGDKHDKAKRILTELWNQENGCLSVQVLQEFFVNVTKKIPQPLPTAVGQNRG